MYCVYDKYVACIIHICEGSGSEDEQNNRIPSLIL